MGFGLTLNGKGIPLSHNFITQQQKTTKPWITGGGPFGKNDLYLGYPKENNTTG